MLEDLGILTLEDEVEEDEDEELQNEETSEEMSLNETIHIEVKLNFLFLVQKQIMI